MTNRQIWPDDVQPVEELSFERLESSYVKVVMGRIFIAYIMLMVCALLIPVMVDTHGIKILIAAECTLTIAFAINLALAKRIYRFKGYALRDKDITYRSGIFFTTVTTVPFKKIQQVSIRMNPLSRIFHLYYVDVINGSQSTMNQITIPGLTIEQAERMKLLLINNTDCADD